MHKVVVGLPLLLAACTASQPVAREPTLGPCTAEPGNQFIGRMATSETGAEILKATHSTILRWAPPGTMLTMDFNPNRVTVRFGPDQKVTQVN